MHKRAQEVKVGLNSLAAPLKSVPIKVKLLCTVHRIKLRTPTGFSHTPVARARVLRQRALQLETLNFQSFLIHIQH